MTSKQHEHDLESHGHDQDTLAHTNTRTGGERLDGTSRAVLMSTNQAFLPVFKGSKIANPSPLAFMSLAVALYVVSIVALGADGMKSLGYVPSIALGYAAVAQLIAGIWEFPSGQPFGAALYISLSGLFFSLTLLLSSWSGVSSSYTDTPDEFSKAVAQFFYVWCITLIVFTFAGHRSSGGLLVVLVLVDLFLLFLGLSYTYPTKTHLLTAAGAFGIIAAFVSWYAALASLLTPESSAFQLPVLGNLAHQEKL
ncbi:hypothetical protein T439DRAFT_320437, partial [Meredithblackwellia eburnea MCA 4105]